jgi:hypothetical protein
MFDQSLIICVQTDITGYDIIAGNGITEEDMSNDVSTEDHPPILQVQAPVISVLLTIGN